MLVVGRYTHALRKAWSSSTPGTPTPDASNANGVIELWIDGEAIGPFASLWVRSTASLEPSVLWLSVYLDAAHPEAGVRFDDVVVSTERVFCR